MTAILRPDAHSPVVHLDVYQMFVPRGAVSRSDEFWKRVDEQQIDPATYDLLLKNGVRVGVARDSDWADYFRDIFERNNARSIPGSILASGSGSLELPMKRNVRSQDIFYLNDQNELYGRTYEKCENLLGVSFWPERRQVGALHITLAPVVRATRSHPEFTVRNEERILVEVRPEYLYDLNLTTTIPPGNFLVMAPSPEGAGRRASAARSSPPKTKPSRRNRCWCSCQERSEGRCRPPRRRPRQTPRRRTERILAEAGVYHNFAIFI